MGTDRGFQDIVRAAGDGWLDLELVKGSNSKTLLDAELLDALTASKWLETKVADDGRVFVRRKGGKPPPFLDGTSMKRKFEMLYGQNGTSRGDDKDPTCWDYKRKGFCPRGDKCKYLHPDGLAGNGNDDAVDGCSAAAVNDEQRVVAEVSAQCAEALGLGSSGAAAP